MKPAPPVMQIRRPWTLLIKNAPRFGRSRWPTHRSRSPYGTPAAPILAMVAGGSRPCHLSLVPEASRLSTSGEARLHADAEVELDAEPAHERDLLADVHVDAEGTVEV